MTTKARGWGGRAATYLILIGWSLFTIFALSWIVLASFKTSREIFREPFKLPAEIQWENYVNAWNSVRLGEYFLNSVIVVTISLILLLAVSAPAAYALSRFKFRGVAIITTVYIVGIGIPYPLLFIPLFGLLAALRVINTLPGLILVYVALSIPFTVFLLTGFFATLPRELEEAALIDGCSNWQTFRKVMLPLAAPGLLTAAIFNGIGLWNEYQLALVFVNNPDNRTLSLGLYSMQNAMQYTGDWPGLFAGVVIVMVPTILLFIILSERMISGITMGAVK
jgi:ABC-type glycerol-3-phosphate transport system permease component